MVKSVMKCKNTLVVMNQWAYGGTSSFGCRSWVKVHILGILCESAVGNLMFFGERKKKISLVLIYSFLDGLLLQVAWESFVINVLIFWWVEAIWLFLLIFGTTAVTANLGKVRAKGYRVGTSYQQDIFQ